MTKERKRFSWTDEIEQEVLDRIASGESVVQFLGNDRDDFLPSETTLYKHVQEDDAFAVKYARAREAQAHHEAEQIRLIADLATPEDVHVARLRIDARKWRASKLAPKSYGDKLDLNVTKPLDEGELDAAIAAKLAAMADSGQG